MSESPAWANGIGLRLKLEERLAPYTTIEIGGPARWFVEPETAEDTARLLGALSAAKIGWKVLGGGSNLLAPDRGVRDEVVIHPVALTHCQINGQRVTLGAGFRLQKAVVLTTGEGLAGLHGLGGIPAQIGGAVAMNAGGRHGWISDVLESIEVAMPDGKLHALKKDELRMGYREAHLPKGAVVVSATFALSSGNAAELKRTAGEITKDKSLKQPTKDRNFGCTWKNPEGQSGVSAGKLAEDAGCKGLTCGRARITSTHGNFIDNDGGATAEDVRQLISRAESLIFAEHGMTLDREVVIWPEPRLPIPSREG